jgi:hypothetical protein
MSGGEVMHETNSLVLRDDEETCSYSISKDADGLIEFTYRDNSHETSIFIQHQHLNDIINALKKML